MKISTDTALAALLFLNAALFALGAIAEWTFAQWIIPDLFAVAVCGAIGFVKRIRLLFAVAAVIVAGMFLRLSIPVWLAIDVFVIVGSWHAGYRLVRRVF